MIKLVRDNVNQATLKDGSQSFAQNAFAFRLLLFEFPIAARTVLPFLLSGILGCGQLINLELPSSDTVAIGQLPQQHQQQETVQVRGKVKKVVPLVGSGAYQLEDETGAIWVVTPETLPQIGDEIIIEGTLNYQSIPIGEKDLGEFYVREIKKN
jgi:predicted small lipoprotein YifL